MAKTINKGSNLSKKELKKKEDFQTAARHIMKFLAENYHPHCTVIVTSNRAEVVEGVLVYSTDEFIQE